MSKRATSDQLPLETGTGYRASGEIKYPRLALTGATLMVIAGLGAGAYLKMNPAYDISSPTPHDIIPSDRAQREMARLEMRKAINDLANHRQPGIDQKFRAFGIWFTAKYIPNRPLECFYDIKPTAGQILPSKYTQNFEPPEQDCADTSKFSSLKPSADLPNRNVVVPPGLGTPQRPPDAFSPGAAPYLQTTRINRAP